MSDELSSSVYALIEDIVSCADPADGGVEDARLLCRRLVQAVRDEMAAGVAPPHASQQFIDVVVNGQPVRVTAGPVRSVIEQAITLSGQIGAPLAQWELRTREGDIIPHTLSDGGEWVLTGGKLLFMTLGLSLPPHASHPAGGGLDEST